MVFVLDRHQTPLMPCSEKRARLLLERGRAVIHQLAPFTIRVKDRTVDGAEAQPLRVKFDPGSKTTGVALLVTGTRGTKVLFLGEIVHKAGIKARLDDRRALRRGRRHRQTRYRAPRFQNRQRTEGWLPPSLAARVQQTLHALAKIRKVAPLTELSVEHVKFDTQALRNPEITGVAYQQGTLLGYEIREYLLEKWGRQCAYCDAQQVPFEIDHVYPKARGGSDRISNLTLACSPCNEQKGKQFLEPFLANDRGRRQRVRRHATSPHWEATRLTRIQQQLTQPLKDAALMNATRWRLYTQLQATGLPVEGGSGGRTKMQRIAHLLPKTHYYDALCVGVSTPAEFTALPTYVHVWSAMGRGTRQLCGTDRYGFPIRHRSRRRQHFGFQTGDLVRAIFPRGKYAGVHRGRVTVRTNGSFVITTATGRAEGHWTHCQLVQRNEGWDYVTIPTQPSNARPPQA